MTKDSSWLLELKSFILSVLEFSLKTPSADLTAIQKCRKDRSIAIAHDLEDICEVEPKAVKKKAKSNKMEEEQIDLI